MQTLRAVVVLVVILSSTGMGIGQTATPPTQPMIVCGDGVRPQMCSLARAQVAASLRRLGLELGGWRWVVASEATWKKKAPAYSLLEARTTYLREDWFAHDTRVNEQLLRYTSLEGDARLDWVVSHELGHIICNTHDEKAAERAGGRIRFGSDWHRACER